MGVLMSMWSFHKMNCDPNMHATTTFKIFFWAELRVYYMLVTFLMTINDFSLVIVVFLSKTK